MKRPLLFHKDLRRICTHTNIGSHLSIVHVFLSLGIFVGIPPSVPVFFRSLLFCFSAFFCFYASLLISAYLLSCLSVFFASLLSVFMCFASTLLCFSAFLLLCFSASLFFLFFCWLLCLLRSFLFSTRFVVVLLDFKCSYNYMKNSASSTNTKSSKYKGTTRTTIATKATITTRTTRETRETRTTTTKRNTTRTKLWCFHVDVFGIFALVERPWCKSAG